MSGALIVRLSGRICSDYNAERGMVVTRKTGWENSTNGPDWIDVEAMMRAIGSLHSAEISLMFSPRGIGATGGLETVAVCTFDVLPGSALPKVVMCTSEWPCKDHATIAAHVYWMLYDLDAEIGRTYQNEKLWK